MSRTAHGWYWIAQAFALFRRNALNWIMLNMALLLIALGLVVVPVIGAYVLYLLTPIFLAGMMSACRDQEAGREVEIAHLFRGFRHNASQLVTVGGVYLVGQVVIAGVVLSIGGAELQEAHAGRCRRAMRSSSLRKAPTGSPSRCWWAARCSCRLPWRCGLRRCW